MARQLNSNIPRVRLNQSLDESIKSTALSVSYVDSSLDEKVLKNCSTLETLTFINSPKTGKFKKK